MTVFINFPVPVQAESNKPKTRFEASQRCSNPNLAAQDDEAMKGTTKRHALGWCKPSLQRTSLAGNSLFGSVEECKDSTLPAGQTVLHDTDASRSLSNTCLDADQGVRQLSVRAGSNPAAPNSILGIVGVESRHANHRQDDAGQRESGLCPKYGIQARLKVSLVRRVMDRLSSRGSDRHCPYSINPNKAGAWQQRRSASRARGFTAHEAASPQNKMPFAGRTEVSRNVQPDTCTVRSVKTSFANDEDSRQVPRPIHFYETLNHIPAVRSWDVNGTQTASRDNFPPLVIRRCRETSYPGRREREE